MNTYDLRFLIDVGVGRRIEQYLTKEGYDTKFLSRETMARLYDLPRDSPYIPFYYPVRHSSTVWRIWRRDKATVRQFELVDWLSQ